MFGSFTCTPNTFSGDNGFDGVGVWMSDDESFEAEAEFDWLTSCAPASSCGDGVIDEGEACDDGNASNGDGCTDACAVESGWYCGGEPSECEATTWEISETKLDLLVGGTVIMSFLLFVVVGLYNRK